MKDDTSVPDDARELCHAPAQKEVDPGIFALLLTAFVVVAVVIIGGFFYPTPYPTQVVQPSVVRPIVSPTQQVSYLPVPVPVSTESWCPTTGTGSGMMAGDCYPPPMATPWEATQTTSPSTTK